MRTFYPLAHSLLFALFTSSTFIAFAAAPNQLTEEEKAGGWKLLFDGNSTNGWHSFKSTHFPQRGWSVQDGWLYSLGKGGGDIVSDGQFEEFELEWEWKQAPRGNSGLKYFVLETHSYALGHEYQLLDDESQDEAKRYDKHATASFYDVLKPTLKVSAKPAGEINQSRIVVKGNHVEHWLNGKKVLEYACGNEEVKTAIAASKFKNIPGFGERVKGHILLQEHGTPVWFRNLKIRDLSKAPKSG